jgi:hypothetical protein
MNKESYKTPLPTRLSDDEIQRLREDVEGLSLQGYTIVLHRTDGSELTMPSKVRTTIDNVEHTRYVESMYLTLVERNISLILIDSVTLLQSLSPAVKCIFARYEPIKSLSIIVDGKIRVQISNNIAKGNMHFCMILKTQPVTPVNVQDELISLDTSRRRYRNICFMLLLLILSMLFRA